MKAKGLLSLMLSLPDTWDYSINGLCALSKDGRDSVLTMELDAGYDYLRECRAKRHLFLSTYAILQKGETLEDFESKRGVKKNEQKGWMKCIVSEMKRRCKYERK